MEVNQRALIDKVLARYSGEFTVFRELLQNSDDASSSEVEIHFDTQAHLDTKESTTSDVEGTSAPGGSANVAIVTGTDGPTKKVPDLKTTNVSLHFNLIGLILTRC